MKTLSTYILRSFALNRNGTGLAVGSLNNNRLLLLACLVIFWANPSFADIYVYEKNGSHYITDSYQGSDYKKRYRTKRSKPKPTSLSKPFAKKSRYTSNDFSSEIFKASKKYGIKPNFIKAVIAAESGFRPDAVSPKGAMGLMQLMPKTAKRFNVDDPFNPNQNIDGGTRYLKLLLKQFRGSRRLVLAAYNAGENQVRKYGTIPPFKETTAYVRKVLKYFNSLERKKTVIYKKISSNGTVSFSDNVQAKFTQ